MAALPRRPCIVVLTISLVLAALTAAGLAPPVAASPVAAAPRPAHPGVPRGLATHHSAGSANTAQHADETRVCQGCSPPLAYGGGPVMSSPSTTGENTEYSLYWDPSNSMGAAYKNIIDQYLTDVAAASGSTSNVYSTDTQYYQQFGSGPTSPIVYRAHFGGRLPVGDPIPGNGCNPDPGYSACLSDAQLQQEIANVINAQGAVVTADLAHMFLLFLPPGVESCDSSNSCSANVFCGYHSDFTLGGANVLYSAMPYATAPGCTSGQQPNGSALADGEIDTLSHEVNETITDPLGTAWMDRTGNEDGDECSTAYGPSIGSTDPANASTTEYNQVINGHRYYTQEEFSNSAFAAGGTGCVQAAGQVAAPPNTVTVTPTPSRVPADGSSASTIAVSVTAPGTSGGPGGPAAGDQVNFSIYAPKGGCGTVSPAQATTNSAGQASTTYTASTTNDALCTIVASDAASSSSGQAVLVQGGETYHALTPYRLADTRGRAGCSTCIVTGPPVGPQGVLSVTVLGEDTVPVDATAAVLNVTTTGGTATSFLTAYGDGPRPNASNLNFVAGQTVANLVTVPISTMSGAVNIFNLAGTTNVIVDLEGYMEPGSGPLGLYNPLTPARITDTRAGSGLPNAGTTPGPTGTVTVTVAGAGGVPASGVAAVVLNVTAVNATAGGFLTAYPAGTSRPNASNVNFVAGRVVPNRVVVPLGSGGANAGKVTIYNYSGSTDVIVDVGGWFTDATSGGSGALFTSLAPQRAADSRPGSGLPLDGQTLGQGGTDTVAVVTVLGLPATTRAVAGNVTVVDTTAPGYLTVFPAGSTRPTASDLNWVAGQVVPNQVLTEVGGGGLSLYNNTGSTDVIVDIAGFFS